MVAILVGRDFENLDFRVDVLNQNALARNTAVFTLFSYGKLSTSGLFLRCLAVFMQLRNALIPAVATNFDFFRYRGAYAAFIKLKVMTTA